MLFASRSEQPLPSFESYYPAQRDYFLAQVANE